MAPLVPKAPAPSAAPALDQGADQPGALARSLEPLPWLPVLETGNATVDREHRQLIEDANAVHALVGAGGSWGELVETARLMRDRCVEHFATEDAVLKATRYPDYTRHIRAHRRILTEIDTIIADMESAAAPTRLHWELALSLRGILVDHLLRDDLRYKSHLMYYDSPRS